MQRLFSRGRYWLSWNFTLVARLEGVINLLVYDLHRGFNVDQMDVKCVFMNEIIEEVYIKQPKIFLDYRKRDMVYKLQKELYGL